MMRAVGPEQEARLGGMRLDFWPPPAWTHGTAPQGAQGPAQAGEVCWASHVTPTAGLCLQPAATILGEHTEEPTAHL